MFVDVYSARWKFTKRECGCEAGDSDNGCKYGFHFAMGEIRSRSDVFDE
jgi:hypothetical protein